MEAEEGVKLKCESENIENWSRNLKAFDKNKEPLGVFNFGYGGLLPRPYGPSDNMNLQYTHLAGSKKHPLPLSWNYQLGQFGKENTKRECGQKRDQKKQKSKLKSLTRARRSGTTPGSKSWVNSVKDIRLGSEWVKPKLAPAKGYNTNPIMLYLPVKDGYRAPEFLNVPRQFSNNQYNNPQPSSLVVNKFGSAGYPSLLKWKVQIMLLTEKE